jgi:hypothetical protein
MYETCESHGAGGNMLRIVRVGSHTGEGNLPDRLSQHFSPRDSWTNFGIDHPKAADRSVFRKHIGRAFLYQSRDTYLHVWNIDYTKVKNRNEKGHLRDIVKEHSLEKQITEWLRSSICFRFIIVDQEEIRQKLEEHCIGTIAFCKNCRPSAKWLGNNSPIKTIQKSGLWNVKHVHDPEISEAEKQIIKAAVIETLQWITMMGCLD